MGRSTAMPLCLLASLLAGCFSGSPAESPAAHGEGPASLTGTDAAEASPAPALPPEPYTVSCTMERTNLGTTTGYGLNIDRAVLGFDECDIEGLFGGNTSWARSLLIEADWTPQASQTGADLYIESDACPPDFPPGTCQQPHAMGASAPLRLELDEAELRRQEGQDALVIASGQGLVVGVVFTLRLTLFPGDLPPGYTAFG